MPTISQVQIPRDAQFVQIVDPLTNKQRWKSVGDVLPTDDIQVSVAGVPITSKVKPGRPVKQPLPTMAAATPLAADAQKLRQESIRNDPVLKAARDKPEDPEVLTQIMEALAVEAANISFERTRAELAGEKTSEISMRHIASLKALGDTWLRRKDQIVSRGIDTNSASFRIYMTFLLETFKSVLVESGVRQEMIETIFARLAKTMDSDWEMEAKNRMKGAV